MLLPLAVLLQLSGAAAPSWRIMERSTIPWWPGAPPYEVLLEESPPLAPDGESDHRIRIRVPGRADFVVVDDRGPGAFVPVREASRSAAPGTVPVELPDTARLLLTTAPTAGRSSLLLAYASDPHELLVIGLDSVGYPAVLYRGKLDLVELTDLDGDGRAELVGIPKLREALSPTPPCRASYAPFAVYRLGERPGSPLVYALGSSRDYNEAHYVWAGPTASDYLEVLGCTPGELRAVDSREPE